jgi:hypothetical protein
MPKVSEIRKYLKLLEEEGVDITRQGFYLSGRTHGFIKNKEDSRELYIDEVIFKQWLEQVTRKVPRDHVPLKKVPELLGISLAQVYKLAKDIPYIKIGRLGVRYVKFEDIKRAWHKYKADRESSWRV